MLKLNAKIRKEKGRKTAVLRKAGRIPAVLYGHKIKNILLDVDSKEFHKVYKTAGESSLIELIIEGDKQKRTVLIHDFQRDPVTDKIIHVDFFEISAKEEVEAKIPLVFEGIAPAVKELGGTLVKNISEVIVKSLPQNLPHKIKVSVNCLKTFNDHILVKDLVLPAGVRVLAKPDEIIASVIAPTKVEEELAKEIKEEVEAVEKIEKKEKKEEVVTEEGAATSQ